MAQIQKMNWPCFVVLLRSVCDVVMSFSGKRSADQFGDRYSNLKALPLHDLSGRPG
jgi:hypothetical protein